MNSADKFGITRAIEPKASLPQPAWKIDNTMELRNDEILIDVKIININLMSFYEILEETEFQEERLERRIMDIIEERGKLHNPVTGTGGMFYGRVLKMGESYPNNYNIEIGDEIVSLTSLSLTPIKLEKIISIDFETAQLEVEGRCILFANSPIVKKPNDLPLKLVVSTLDEAGAPCRTYRIVKKNQNVVIIGANGKMGLLCAYAAKDRLQGTGYLVGIVKSKQSKKLLESYNIFDEVLQADATDVTGFYELKSKDNDSEKYDVVINCVNSLNTEMASLLLVKNKGIVYFATQSCDYKLTSLTAEGIGKEVDIIPYTGFLEGHSDYTLNLVRNFKGLQELLQYKINNSLSYCAIRRQREALNQPEGLGYTENYIFASNEARKTLREAIKVSQYNSNVLIYGESGVGKEIIAKIIHQNSTRKSFPIIKINCASIPENLLESELFGYEKGSFTGANRNGKIGLWEAAQNGTLFLDEVGELSMSFQAKILRVIQEKEIIRVGGISPIKVDARIIAATNKNLTEMMRQGLFREDLYYRLNVFPLTILPLRQRRDDIIPLINCFTEKYNAEFHTKVQISNQAKQYLSKCSFRGNIRELQNLIQRVIITTEHKMVDVKDIILAMSYDKEEDLVQFTQKVQKKRETIFDEYNTKNITERTSLKAILCEVEEAVLREYKNKYCSTRQIAEALGISQSSVVRKMQQYGFNSDD